MVFYFLRESPQKIPDFIFSLWFEKSQPRIGPSLDSDAIVLPLLGWETISYRTVMFFRLVTSPSQSSSRLELPLHVGRHMNSPAIRSRERGTWISAGQCARTADGCIECLEKLKDIYTVDGRNPGFHHLIWRKPLFWPVAWYLIVKPQGAPVIFWGKL